MCALPRHGAKIHARERAAATAPLLECLTYRFHGHHVGDIDRAYCSTTDREREEEEWKCKARPGEAAPRFWLREECKPADGVFFQRIESEVYDGIQRHRKPWPATRRIRRRMKWIQRWLCVRHEGDGHWADSEIFWICDLRGRFLRLADSDMTKKFRLRFGGFDPTIENPKSKIENWRGLSPSHSRYVGLWLRRSGPGKAPPGWRGRVGGLVVTRIIAAQRRAFRQGVGLSAIVRGKNIAMKRMPMGGGRASTRYRPSGLAPEELVQLKVDIIFAASGPQQRAARKRLA